MTPSELCSAQAARPPDRSRAATASVPCSAAVEVLGHPHVSRAMPFIPCRAFRRTERRKSVALGASILKNAERAAAAGLSPPMPGLCSLRNALLTLPHGESAQQRFSERQAATDSTLETGDVAVGSLPSLGKSRPAERPHAKLCGQGPRAEAGAACRLPRIPLDSDTRTAACMTLRRFCSAEGLQPRAEAGPQRLQREVRRRRLCVRPHLKVLASAWPR
jgi:hypothetical protein